MRKIDLIILHCSASDIPIQRTAEAITELHIASKDKYFKWGHYDTTGKAFAACGYNYVIEPSGEIVKTRSELLAGAHCRDFNSRSIGICLAGNREFTPMQFASLENLVNDIKERHNLSSLDVLHHNELNTYKTCPNFNYWEEIKQK